ncbi:MAG: EFR1 family ferrodoxin [Bacteroidales bacterium]|nr:EFR1 family ferrodoxin [Bacteroidales bacterium]
MIDNISLVYFSPTKTSKKIVEAIALGINPKSISHFDLTLSTFDSNSFNKFNNELVIIGVPVYSGRVPIDATKRLKKLKTNKVPTIIVVVYGNREYDDALLELKDIAKDRGFMPFAAAAFIGEHSFTTEQFPLAPGRPDTNDLSKASELGAEIRNILVINKTSKLVNVPGNKPYREFTKRPIVSPVTIDEKCDRCGICVSVCPTDAIYIDETVITDKSSCILCCACVKECPTGARVNDNDVVKSINKRLFENCTTRKEPEIFIFNISN